LTYPQFTTKDGKSCGIFNILWIVYVKNQQGSMEEAQFEMMDGFHGNSTPPGMMNMQYGNMSDAAAAQKQFHEVESY